MKISFKRDFAIDKCFRTQELPAKPVESTFNVKRMPEKGMQIPLLAGAVYLKEQIKDEFIDSPCEFLKGTATKIGARFGSL